MSGYQTYTRWQRIEEQALNLGFRLGMPRASGGWNRMEDGDMVTLYPAEGALPVYTRDADIWTGSFRDCEIFLNGWARAQQYDQLLRMTDDKRRKRYEDAEVARQALRKKREEQAEMLSVLRATDAENRGKKK